MTTRNPWRRTWRDKVIPILWLLVAVVIIGGAAGINSAHATPASLGQLYADEHAADICTSLDAHPTVGGIIDALDDMQANGLTHRESAVALMESVAYVCPIHADLLQKLLARAQPAPAPGRELVA